MKLYILNVCRVPGYASACIRFLVHLQNINLFSTNVQLLLPLKTENLRFSDVFGGYRSGTLVENGLVTKFITFTHFNDLNIPFQLSSQKLLQKP